MERDFHTEGAEASSVRLVGLSARLVYSLIKAAARIAARFDMPLDRFISLAELGLFAAHRERSPRDLRGISKKLGVSLRTVSTLNKRFKADFFAPEAEVESVRRVAAALLCGPQSVAGLREKLADLEDAAIERALRVLQEHGWASRGESDEATLTGGMRSWVSDEWNRRVDGLNNQVEVIARSVWARFVDDDHATSAARSWVFAAKPSELAKFVDASLHSLRHGAIDLEESALSAGVFNRYGITVAVAPIEDEER